MERGQRIQLDPSLLAKTKLNGRPRWPKPGSGLALRLTVIGLLVSILGLGVSIFFGLFDVPRRAFPFRGSSDPIYLEDPGFQKKGLPPTIADLDFENDRSPGRLKNCFDLRSSLDPEDLKDAAACVRRILDDEGRNPSLRTRSDLVAALGEIYLKLGDYEEAARLLEEARKHWPNNEEATKRLLRAYEALRDQYREQIGPWSEEDGAEVRRLLDKIEELEGDLVRLSVERLAALGASVKLIEVREEHHVASHTLTPVRFTLTVNNLGLERPRDVTISYHGLEDRIVTTCEPGTGGDGCLVAPALWPDPEPRARVVSIGVDNAGTLGLPPLRHAAADARRIARAFEGLGFDAVDLVDGTATRDTILLTLAVEMLASRPGDELVVYYSGHGFTDAAGNGAIVTHEYDGLGNLVRIEDSGGRISTFTYDASNGLSQVDATGDSGGRIVNIAGAAANNFGVLSLKELEAVLSHHRGKVTVIVDACLDERDVDLGNPVTGPVGANRPTFLLAAAPGQIAIESNRLGGGVFTHALDAYLHNLAVHFDDAPFDVDTAAGIVRAETARLAMELHGVEQVPQVLVEVDRR